MKRFATGPLPIPAFFKVLDVAQRVAGVGALGLKRYVVLAEGDGGARRRRPDRSQDPERLHPDPAPEAAPAALRAARPRAWWRSRTRMQAVGPAFLTPARIGGGSFTLRELQPSADKLDLSTTHPDRRRSRR